MHRSVEFVFCPTCNHLQTFLQPPPGYPAVDGGSGFDKIYPELDETAFSSRRDRIYAPKLDWALKAAEKAGIKRESFLSKKWVELGCGAGYFLYACLKAGVQNITGIESNSELTARARVHVPTAKIFETSAPLSETIREYSADVYCAFFVFEHIEEAKALYESLTALPKGTLLLYSIPIFGFSALVDGLFENLPAKMLDGVVHTQLYTEESINYALKIAGFTPLAEWIFGSDTIALIEAMLLALKENMSAGQHDSLSERLLTLIDPLQSAIDQSRFADERHILAIRN